MLVVPMQPGATLKAGRPQVLFEAAMSVQGVGVRPYDIAPDKVMRSIELFGQYVIPAFR